MNFQTFWLHSKKTSRTDIIYLQMSNRFNVQRRLQLHIPVILCSNLLSVQLQVKWTVTPDGLDHFIVASCEDIDSWTYHLLLTLTTTCGFDIDCFILVNCVLCSYRSRWCANNCFSQIQYELCLAAIIEWIITFAVPRAHIRCPLLVDRPEHYY